MTNIAETLRHAAEQLEAVSETPRLDSELLMAHALDMERGAMLLNKMRDPAPAVFGPMLLRRLAHEPVAYIAGKAEFWSLPLMVTPDVLIPRGDSETLIEAARDYFANISPRRILDLGTGSGALLLAALSEWREAHGLAMDQSAKALAVAHNNADHLQLSDRCQFVCQSWHDMDWADLGQFDLILCNPPYVESNATLAPQVRDYEPHQALFAGPEGLDDYRHLLPYMPQLLDPDGAAIFEIGATQAESVQNIAQENTLRSQLYHDLAGKPRALSFTHAANSKDQ
ncbi:peptide chain release factor N(5)-glutamine methyltransferase [Alterisphingorhabdus coralli]|uniref:Release factor glutamine methyltransferase n=1 Tax=Alterisphingorhabdus coralli TaxID=3071408 RepID=A0AA97I2G0_9SPHN|nr:peptide chain release factor N(5)-glutamine methyltransferase [Parasphingorhabdus sp. SCSIO 66989]WOE75725.1 peptide chain release factor N(5)-glutamine methyltransferase [Parasphingorhabdus sp. SCSIO 66989]